jgi:tetratricopeptide (TPR) repeat protein
MSEPLRTEPSRTHEPVSRAGREAKIEQLLLGGLDHYFAEQYDQAIAVWTRVLFLDRSHARARAYIERARSAQAERQRESEALMHEGAEAVRRGDRGEARRLLDAALQQGGTSDDVLDLLERVERLEQIAVPIDPEAEEFQTPRLMLDVPVPVGRSRLAWATLAVLVLVILAAAAFAASAGRSEIRSLVARSALRQPAPASVLVPARDQGGLPIPRRSELAVSRARALMGSGRLRDALPLLESVRPTDPERAEADRMRGDIQRQLIAVGALPASQPMAPAAPATEVRP